MSGIDKDNFEAAFDELATLGEGQQPKFDDKPDESAAPVASSEPAEQPAEPAAEAPAGVDGDGGVDGGDQTGAAGDDDTGAGDADEPESADQEPAQQSATPEQQALSRFTELLERQERERQEYIQQQQAAAQQPQQDEPLFSEEDVAKLKEFQQEWPDVMDALQRAQRAQGKLFTQMMERRVAEALAPFQNVLQSVAVRSHLTDIQSAIPTYDTERDQVIEWARSDKHPKYLRDAYESVIREGTAEDIRSLFEQYHAATGQAARPAPSPRARNTELPPAAKQAAASLAPVGSQRSATSTTATPDNFEDAFKQWAGLDL